MPNRALTNVGLNTDWDLAEDGWKAGMDYNLLMLDTLVQPRVVDIGVDNPPSSPAAGDAYIVGPNPTGDWSGRPNAIAVYDESTWTLVDPLEGWRVHNLANGRRYQFDGTNWLPTTPLNNLSATAAPGVNDDETAGYQPLSRWLDTSTSDGEFYVCISAAAGAAQWAKASLTLDELSNLAVTEASAVGLNAVALPTPPGPRYLRVNGDGSITMLDAAAAYDAINAGATGLDALASKPIFTPGGDGVISFYRNDLPRSQNPRTAVIDSITDDVITLTTNDSDLFFDSRMENVSYVRIWNTSKVPEESAWLRSTPAVNQLRVLASSDISGWSNGETVQIGDPTSVTAGRFIALDISQMLQNVLGEVFRQSAILCKSGLQSDTVASKLDVAPSGDLGANVVAVRNADTSNVWNGTAVFPCTELSPISNSNLVFVGETSGGQLSTSLLNSIAVYA